MTKARELKIILHLQPDSDGVPALVAALMLQREGHEQCVYGFEGGAKVFARRNKASITAYEEPKQ